MNNKFRIKYVFIPFFGACLKVGYGDMVPVSDLGKTIAALTAVFGLALVALPIAVIGSNFSKIYFEEERESKLIKKHKQIIDSEEIFY